jgi:hypothetical protein
MPNMMKWHNFLYLAENFFKYFYKHLFDQLTLEQDTHFCVYEEGLRDSF